MRRRFVIFSVVLLTNGLLAQERHTLPLNNVNTICVVSIETSTLDTLRFKMLVEEQLTKARFKVMDDPSAADAVLSFILERNRFGFSVTAVLKDGVGTRLWGESFVPKIRTANAIASALSAVSRPGQNPEADPTNYSGTQEDRAKEIAKRLRKDVDGANKKTSKTG